MIRTFIRFAIVMSALLGSSALLWTWLVEPALDIDTERSLRALMQGPVLAATDAVTSAEPSQRESLRLQWEQTLGMPVALVDGSASVPPGEMEIELEGDEAYIRTSAHGTALRMGPVPNPPWTAVNEAVTTSFYLDVLLVFAASVLLTIPLLLRLRRLRLAADAIASGDASARAQLSGRDELGRVGARFDAMADAVQRALQRQRELLQAVSHEFRTPIARLRFLVEEIVDSDAVEQRRAVRQEMERDLAELDELVDEILTYARLEDAQSGPPQSTFVADVIDAIASSLSGMSTPIHVEPGPAVDAALATRDLGRAIRNLVANAQRHAAGRVEVRWFVEADQVVITVDDDGDGVAPDDRESIFEPFFRGSRGGHGLGLALVQRIADRNGGSVTVDDAPLGGARFVLSVPRSSDDSD